MVIRKQYTKEFKLDAISLVLDQGHTTTEVSRSLEINANMLRRWIREYQADDADQSFRGNGKLELELSHFDGQFFHGVEKVSTCESGLQFIAI